MRSQEIGGRDEIGVEDGDELAGGGLETLLQRARLVAVAVRTVVVLDRMPHRLIRAAQAPR